MPNYLHPIQSNYRKAIKELEGAVELIEESSSEVSPLQSLNVTDRMAELFKEKPVILIQYMNVKIVQINNQLNNALRLLDKIDIALYRESVLRNSGIKKTRKEDGKNAE